MSWFGRLCLAGVLSVACTSTPAPGPTLQGGDPADGGLFLPGVTAESSGDTESTGAPPDGAAVENPAGSTAPTGVSETPPSPGITSGGTTAPTGIASAPDAPAPAGGAGPPGADEAACAALDRTYAAALVRATACDFFALGPTCQLDAEVSLACPTCRVAVQNVSELVVLRAQWRSLGCDLRARDCSAACTNLGRGICVPRGAAGVCDGTTAVTPSF